MLYPYDLNNKEWFIDNGVDAEDLTDDPGVMIWEIFEDSKVRGFVFCYLNKVIAVKTFNYYGIIKNWYL